MRHAIVLGAGIVGVASALHLQRRGWSVALVDRREPGRETSYGNAGIIQSEAVRPYPMPRDLRSLVKIAAGRTNDVHYDIGALHQHAEPLARYWWHSAPRRHARISESYARVIAQATREHDALIRQTAADHLIRRAGFRVMFRRQEAFNEALVMAERNRVRWGVRFQPLSPDDLARAEPDLAQTGMGAIHWLDPWTVSDPGALVTAYADLFVQLGGTLLRGDAATLAPVSSGAGWTVDTADGRIGAEAVVVALGPWSADVLRPFGYRFPMVRKRGYHQHFSGGGRLNLPLMDASFGYVLAPMARGLRITTGAQLTKPDAPSAPVQLGRAETAAREVIDLGSPVDPAPWFGTRPCMPDMLPVIGPAQRHKGLWMNFGHGHQGFTLGPVTGGMLAEMMSSAIPDVETNAFRPDRW